MADLKIFKSKLQGSVKIPPSKSLAHRAIICASLAEGKSKIENIIYSDDMIATIDGMKKLGANIEKFDDYLIIEGINMDFDLRKEKDVVIDCNESGSTLRFLIPISLLVDGQKKFIGKGNLGKRPLDIYYEIFKRDNVAYSYEKNILNLEVNGQLKGGDYYLPGNISSQFISGLLFTLPMIKKDSKIIITTELESKAYVDLTLAMLSEFGIEIINNDYKEFIIKGNQKYKCKDYRVEGDYSQAAFFLCANELGSDIKIDDLLPDSAQADRKILEIMPQGNAVIDGSQCPDIIPVVSLVAALKRGKTEIINIGRLRIKECDRLTAIAKELNKLGANVEERETSLIITGVEKLKGGAEVWSHKDHRIAMTLAIAALVCEEPIILKDYECVSKSYPSFFKEYENLGGIINEWNVGE